jgi:hypothetical protein
VLFSGACIEELVTGIGAYAVREHPVALKGPPN